MAGLEEPPKTGVGGLPQLSKPSTGSAKGSLAACLAAVIGVIVGVILVGLPGTIILESTAPASSYLFGREAPSRTGEFAAFAVALIWPAGIPIGYLIVYRILAGRFVSRRRQDLVFAGFLLLFVLALAFYMHFTSGSTADSSSPFLR